MPLSTVFSLNIFAMRQSCKYVSWQMEQRQAPDTDVYVLLYNNYTDALYAYGIGLGFDADTVKDAVHDMFLGFMNRQVDLSRVENIKAYLFRTLHNRLIDLYRAQVDTCVLSDREYSMQVSLTSLDTLIESEQTQRIRRTIESMLNRLSPKQREAVWMRYICEMDYDDIAVILDATPHAARKFVSKALKKLRRTGLAKE